VKGAADATRAVQPGPRPAEPGVSAAHQEIQTGRLRWRMMRRGLLELDLVFDRFLAGRFASLEPDQLAALDRLLDCEDIELWAMISGRTPCERPEFAELVELLRAA
jgi:succinate dehydrogenase flavin-adding protein (antitoxin of CptAB toxin-antitoxin module)